MFLRFLGRIYLYFIVLPAIAPFLKRIVHNVLLMTVTKQQSAMTPEQKARFDRITRNINSPRSSRR